MHVLHAFFPTCQVRVVRFYVSLPRPPPPRPPPDGPQWQCSPPDLNHERWLAVLPAGPQPRALLGSVPQHTTTSPNTQPQRHIQSTQPQHTITAHNHKDTFKAHNHNTQPEDPQKKSRTSKFTTMATCSSPWHEDKSARSKVMFVFITTAFLNCH